MDTIKGWFGKAKGKVRNKELDAIDQAKDLAGEFKDKFNRDDDDKGDDGGQ